MARWNVRCSREKCKLRFVFTKHPDEYRMPRKCPGCGGTRFRVIPNRSKDRNATLCDCGGHVFGSVRASNFSASMPSHRRGSQGCHFDADGTARASLITSDAQLTLALTTGWHDGPLFIVQKRRAPIIHGGTLGGKRRRAREKRATPSWLTTTQLAEIRCLYRQAAQFTRNTSEMHVVDHIVPLDGKLVCGLHVPWNMRVIHWRANAVKSWHTWPDMPFEQLEIF